MSADQLKGGLHVGADGLIRTTFTHDPSTLRLASKAPALMNLPREGAVRGMFVAPPGHTFWAVDFAGIENIIVGWLAKSERYVRLSKLDMHSFFTAHVLAEIDKKLPASDVPQEGWPDNQLREALKDIKRRFPKQRQDNKPHIHGSNYMEGPGMIQETMLKDSKVVVPLKQLKRLQGFYFELFPEIRHWQRRVMGVDEENPTEIHPDAANLPEPENAYRGWLRTPFGNIHRYYDVLTYVRGPKGWELRPSTDAKRAVAFVPQSCARFVLTRAAQRLTPHVQRTLRLFIHDEMLGLCPTFELESILHAAEIEMMMPVPELGGMVFPTEAKAGPSWGGMKGL